MGQSHLKFIAVIVSTFGLINLSQAIQPVKFSCYIYDRNEAFVCAEAEVEESLVPMLKTVLCDLTKKSLPGDTVSRYVEGKGCAQGGALGLCMKNTAGVTMKTVYYKQKKRNPEKLSGTYSSQCENMKGQWTSL